MVKILLVLLFVTLVCAKKMEQRPFVEAPNDNLDVFYTFSSPDSSLYRTLELSHDSKTLHIGGKNMVFGQNSDDIRKASFSSVPWESTKKEYDACLSYRMEGQKCYNMIQIIQQLNSTHILICGSNAFAPKNKILYREREDDNFILAEDSMTSSPICSFDPTDSVSSLMISDKNGNNIFSTKRSFGSEISFVKVMPSLVMSKRKIKKDVVSSFSANDRVMGHDMKKVYFVADENFAESLEASTITQVCANDIGGKHKLILEWTSLLKVRLLCQTAEENPLKFDKMTDMTMGSNQILYGTFTTRPETSRANAVCAFRLSDIQKAFNGGKIYEKSDTSKFATYPEASTIRPGICAYPGMLEDNPSASTSKYFPIGHLTFMSENYLVADIVKSAHPANSSIKMPLLVKDGEKFTKIAVEQVTSMDGTSFDVIFVGKEDGSIYKFVSFQVANKVETLELAQYQPTTEPILSMKLSTELGNIYIGTEKGVHQISTSNCEAYTKSCEFCDPCSMCVLSRDPGCAWDKEAKMCVSIRNRRKEKLYQDVIHGNVHVQCGSISSPEDIPKKKVAIGATEMFGHLVLNPKIVYTWYKYEGALKSAKISNKQGKYRITPYGQLTISNFAASDNARYECVYTVNSCTVNITAYDVKDSFSVLPPVSPKTDTNTPLINITKAPPIVSTSQTTTTQSPLAQSGLQIGLIVGILLVVVLITVVLICMRWRKKNKYSPTKKDESSKNTVVADSALQMTTHDNRTDNNNIHRLRYESEHDQRSHRPLLESQEHQTIVNTLQETQPDSLPTPSQRHAKSLDDLNEQDSMGFIDEDDGAASDEHSVKKKTGSVREKAGRKRVPPARTKSMPGSALYVMFGGQKVKCSTLTRNKQGTWTIEVRPNQSVLQSFDKDDVIDILDDSETLDTTEKSDPNLELSTVNPKFLDGTPKTKSTLALQNAENRRAFFGADSSKLNADRSLDVQYMTSTPNSLSNKTFSIAEGAKQALTEQHSQASLRSLGQNSSEERDSDTTVKGSSMTLQHEDTSSTLLPQLCTSDVSALQNSSDVSSNKNRKNRSVRNSDSYNCSNKSLDRSSGSSDGDEHLHGRDKNVTRKNKRSMDSPSKESRTSQGSSSSSGDYKSARSSMISEQSHDHR